VGIEKTVFEDVWFDEDERVVVVLVRPVARPQDQTTPVPGRT
jgi:hypothetical protein